MRKNHKMANICRSLRKKKKFSSPQVTYPCRIYWCKKMGRKSHTWAPLMVMMRENPLLRPLEGAGPKILNFFWTQMALASLVAIWGPTPSNDPQNGFSCNSSDVMNSADWNIPRITICFLLYIERSAILFWTPDAPWRVPKRLRTAFCLLKGEGFFKKCT
jgi:hypothetical protein